MSDDLTFDTANAAADDAYPADTSTGTAWDREIVPYQEDATFTQFEYGPSAKLIESDYTGTWNRAVIDVDGDGDGEVFASVQGEGVIIMVDAEGDGEFEDSQFLTYEELEQASPELADLLSPENGFTPTEDAAYQPAQVNYDTTTATSPYWFQQAANGLCVPASVAQIVSEYSGVSFENEAEFVELANQYGLFSVGPDGVPSMTAEGALFLMEQAGVPASMIVSANLDVLDGYLEAGHGVVISVDSSEVWHGEGSGAADHALLVEDIDFDTGLAILSDPGNPEGNGYTLPLSDFEEAWGAGGNTMIVADEPAPGVPGVDTTVFQSQPGPAMAADLASHQGGSEFEPAADSGIELRSTPVDAVISVVRRSPWILLPVAIGIRHLTQR